MPRYIRKTYFWNQTGKIESCEIEIAWSGREGRIIPWTRGATVEKHLKVMLNPPIFSQMLVLMWEACQWVLVPKFSMIFELQAFKSESTKKNQF